MAKELRVVIAGDSTALQAALSRASGATAGFAASVSRVGSRVSSTGASLTKGLTLPIVGLAALSGKAAVDFQNSMELLHTQAGLAQGAIAGLSASVLKLAGPTATAPDELAAGLYHLSSQGLRGANAMRALQIAAEGAKMGQANLEDVTNALGAVLSSGVSGVHSYGQAMGELNATVGSGDMRMQDLADAMGTGLPAKAAIYGFSLRDVSAALAVFGDNNIRGAEAGTQMNSMMRLMVAPSGAAQKAMAKIGLSASDLGNTIRDKGLVSGLELLKSHLDGLSKVQQGLDLTRMFGGKQAGGVLILLDQLERLKTKVKAVDDGGAAFAANWSAYTQTAAYHLASMGAAMQASGVTIGDILLPVISELANKISVAVRWFDGLSAGTKKFILIAAGVVAVLGPVLSIVGSLITVIGALSSALMFLAANPIVLAIAAVAALVAIIAAALIWPQQFKKVLESMGLSAQHAGEVLSVLQGVFHAIQTVVSAVVQAVEAVWAQFGATIVAQTQISWNLMKLMVQQNLQVFRGIINIFTGLIHGDWSRAWDGVKQVFSAQWTIMRAIVGSAMASIKLTVLTDARLAESVLRTAWGAIRRDAAAAWDGIKSAVGAAVDAMAGVVRKGVDKVVAFVKTLPGELLALGEAAGAALLRGVADGIKSMFQPAIDAANAAKNALKSVWHSAFGSTPDEWGNYAVGTPLMQGIANGIAASQGLVTGKAAQAKQALKQSLEAREIYGLVTEYGRQLGLKQAEGVVGGILTGTPSIVNQVRSALQQAAQAAQQAVVQARAGLTQAFGQLAGEALSAFDQKVQAWQSPASKLLAKMQLQDQVKAAADAVSQANDQLAQAQAALAASTDPDTQALAGLTQQATDAQIALDNLKASGTATKEQIAAANGTYTQAAAAVKAFTLSHPGVSGNTDTASLIAAVTTAQQQVAAATRAQKEQELQQEDAAQQASYQKRMATQRDQMARQLVQLQQELLKHPAAWRTMGSKVEGVLKQYGVRMVPSGQEWASMFANGIRQGIPAVEAAAKAMAQAVDNYMPHSPAKTGPLSYDAARSGKAWAERFHDGFAGSFPDINGQTAALMAPGRGGGVPGGAGAGRLVHVENMNVRDDTDVRLVARELAMKLGAV